VNVIPQAVNTPGCNKCGKIFLDCQCSREQLEADAASSTQPGQELDDVANLFAIEICTVLTVETSGSVIVPTTLKKQIASRFKRKLLEDRAAASRTVERPTEFVTSSTVAGWGGGEPEGASHENADRRDAAELEQNKAAVASLGALSATPSLRNERSAELLEREGAEREAFVAWKFRVSWNRRRGLNDNDTTGIDLMLDFAYRAGAAQRGHVSDSEGGNRNG
jgi:hypothetical protein